MGVRLWTKWLWVWVQLQSHKKGWFSILTLKKNEFHIFPHFLMEDIFDQIHMIKPNVWIAIADLKDAIYSVKIHPDHEKYSKFYWNKLIQYPNMPNRHENINKILKVNFATSQKNSQCLLIIDISKEIH